MNENGDTTFKEEWEKGMLEIREQVAEINRMYIKNSTEWELRHSRMVEREKQMDKRQDRTQQHLDHITKLIGVVFDDLDNVGEGLENTGKFLSYKRIR